MLRRKFVKTQRKVMKAVLGALKDSKLTLTQQRDVVYLVVHDIPDELRKKRRRH